MGYRQTQGLDKSVTKAVKNFLFGRGEKKEEKISESQFMDMRGDVKGRDMYQAITYYRILDEYYGSEASKVIANLLLRLSVSTKRMGRMEAVTVLLQRLPKEEEIPIGTDTMLRRQEGG
jgi:hypothetical protein